MSGGSGGSGVGLHVLSVCCGAARVISICGTMDELDQIGLGVLELQ